MHCCVALVLAKRQGSQVLDRAHLAAIAAILFVDDVDLWTADTFRTCHASSSCCTLGMSFISMATSTAHLRRYGARLV